MLNQKRSDLGIQNRLRIELHLTCNFCFRAEQNLRSKIGALALSVFEVAGVMLIGIRKAYRLNSATPMVTVAHATVAKALVVCAVVSARYEPL
jgi:hypothetical protein